MFVERGNSRGAGALQVAGTMSWSGGTILSGGGFSIASSGNLAVGGNDLYLSGTSLANSGTIAIRLPQFLRPRDQRHDRQPQRRRFRLPKQFFDFHRCGIGANLQQCRHVLFRFSDYHHRHGQDHRFRQGRDARGEIYRARYPDDRSLVAAVPEPSVGMLLSLAGIAAWLFCLRGVVSTR